MAKTQKSTNAANIETGVDMAKEGTDRQVRIYHFPEHGITVEADTLEEATEELNKRLATLKDIKDASEDQE